MKMTRREFLVWLGGTFCLGMLGWLVGRKLRAVPEPVPEAPFEPPMFAVRPKHTLNGVSFQVDRAKRTVLANMEYSKADAAGLHFNATLCIPDGASCYLVEAVISYKGEMTMKLLEY